MFWDMPAKYVDIGGYESSFMFVRSPSGDKTEVNMRIAYLILCHKNPKQVEKLIQQLDDGNCDFFLHIDKKVDISPYQFTLKNIYYVPDSKRVDIKWASVEMVYATLLLMDLVRETHIKYDYISLLSGQDFPIKSNVEIQSYLQDNKGFNFIEIVPRSDWRYKRYLKRNLLYYPKWMYSESRITKVLKRLYVLLTGGNNYTFSVFYRKNNLATDFEFGSQWWCFTYDCFCWILDYIKGNPQFLRFYKNAMTADESFFQTVFMVSPYKNERMDKITYLEMGNNHPKVFTEDDYELLMNGRSELFARKFDDNVNSVIMSKIGKNIKNIPS